MKQVHRKMLVMTVSSALLLGSGLLAHADAIKDMPASTDASPAPKHESKGKSGSVGQYVDDATITARVKSRFASDDTVSATRIKVDTVKGIVELSGKVSSETEREQAVTIAKGVPDVRGVRNNLTVQASLGKQEKSNPPS